MSTFWLIVLTSLFTLMWQEIFGWWRNRRRLRKMKQQIEQDLKTTASTTPVVLSEMGFTLQGLDLSNPKNNPLIRDYLEWKEQRDRDAHS